MPTYSITFRQEKGSKLSIEEMDNNFKYLLESSNLIWEISDTGISYKKTDGQGNDFEVLHNNLTGGTSSVIPALFSGTIYNGFNSDTSKLDNSFFDIFISDNMVGITRPAKLISVGGGLFAGGTASSVRMTMCPMAIDTQDNSFFPVYGINVENNHGDNFGFMLSFDGTFKNENAIKIGDIQDNHILESGQIRYNGTFQGYDGNSWQSFTTRTRSVISIFNNTTAGSASNTDYVYIIGTSATLTLPNAVNNTNEYRIKNVDASPCAIIATNSQTIDGTYSHVLSSQYSSVTIISDGVNWITF